MDVVQLEVLADAKHIPESLNAGKTTNNDQLLFLRCIVELHCALVSSLAKRSQFFKSALKRLFLLDLHLHLPLQVIQLRLQRFLLTAHFL